MIHIVIPAYNEERNLPGLIRDIARTIPQKDYDITIVDDGSHDNTAFAAHRLSTQHPLSVLRHASNRGVAEAFRTGLTHVASTAAPSDVIIIMEGDGTSSPELIPVLARRISSGADIVIASRYQTGGAYRKFPLKRLILSKGANLVFQRAVPVPGVKDYSIFFRAYRAHPIQQALRHYGSHFITAKTFFANIEILMNLRPFISSIEEVPFIYDYSKKQGKSGMKIWKNLRSYIFFLARYALRPYRP